MRNNFSQKGQSNIDNIASFDNKNKIGIYVHIPFCRSKCVYCDFCSYAGQQSKFQRYADCLKKEIKLYSSVAFGRVVSSIFIGGGTPSFFDVDLLVGIIDEIRKCFVVKNDAEFTIEGNPDSISDDFVKKMTDNGVNRFSIGLQSSSDRLLSILNRPHDFKDFCRAMESVSKRCKNTSVDVMVGLPQQTLKDVEDTIINLDAFDVKHVSVYGLILERGTVLNRLVSRGDVLLPSDDLSTDMYEKAMEMLKSRGIERYEVSNFAKKGFECSHNVNYWDWGEYLGFGLSAHGFFKGIRYHNHRKFDRYFNKIDNNIRPVSSSKKIKGDEACFEYMITNLRKTKGFVKQDFVDKFGLECTDKYGAINRLLDGGLLVDDGKSIYVSSSKIYVLNDILTEFVPSKE